MKTWIAVINKTEARFFEAKNLQATDLKFVSKLENPRGRLRAGDINADKPGYFAGSPTHGGSMTSNQSPVDRVAQVFAKEIAEHLERHFLKNDFAQLTLIVEPHFLGKIRAALSKDLAAAVNREIPKDLRKVSVEQLRERL